MTGPRNRDDLAGHEPEYVWLTLWLVCVAAIVVFPKWQVVPFDVIWVSLAMVYGFRLWPGRRTTALIVTAMLTTAALIAEDAVRHVRYSDSVEQMPLLAALFVVMVWQANKRVLTIDRGQIAAEAERLLRQQRQFLQDASHQLRTPITIALGHAELLAGALAGSDQRDIDVVVGELERLRVLSERLLLVAASENPDFLSLAPVDLEFVAVDLLRRWRPTADRDWRLLHIEQAWTFADAERLNMALDALVENAVRHTGPGDMVAVSVHGDGDDGFTRIVIEDTGEGIAEHDIPHVFDRFTTIGGETRGTGLGLALVRAIATGHGGGVAVRSVLGQGSSFELSLPAIDPPGPSGHGPLGHGGGSESETGDMIVTREAWCD